MVELCFCKTQPKQHPEAAFFLKTQLQSAFFVVYITPNIKVVQLILRFLSNTDKIFLHTKKNLSFSISLIKASKNIKVTSQ